MNKVWKVLFVDDDHRYAEPLLDRAYNAGLDLDHYDNWEEAFSTLQQDFSKYHAVIIDGKGKLNKDSKSDDQHHLSTAIGDLRELKGSNKLIPYAILSKYIDLRDTFHYRIFEKGKDEQALFDFLLAEIECSEVNLIKAKYKDVFEVFALGYLDKTSEDNLIKAIKASESQSIDSSSYVLLRKIIESIYQRINEMDESIISYECLRFENNKINFALCERRLKGQTINEMVNGRPGKILYPAVSPVLPPYIMDVITPFTSLLNSSSHIGQEGNKSRFTYGTALFFILDLLLWFKKFAGNYQPDMQKLNQ